VGQEKMQAKHSTTEGRHDEIEIPSATRPFAVANKNKQTNKQNEMTKPMKINKKFTFATLATLATLAATLLFQTSITRADAHGQNGNHGQRGNDNDREDRDQPIPVAIYDTFKITTPPTPGFGSSWTGVVAVIIGPNVLNGTSRMDVNVTNGIAYCKFTWVIPGVGTLGTSSSVCKLAGNNGIGAWSIENGTGGLERRLIGATKPARPPGRLHPPRLHRRTTARAVLELR